jgi:hypothetical protein
LVAVAQCRPMNETPDQPRRPDQDRRDQQDDPTASDPLDGQPPPDDDDEDEGDEDEHQAPSRRRIPSRGRLAAAGLAVVVLLGGGAALALDGDGGGDNDTASSSDDDPSSPEDAAFEFARCMRDNGIEDFPDPQVSGDGGISFGGSLADQRDTEEFQAAQEACQHLLDDAGPDPEGEPLTPAERAELQDQWHTVAQCVRDQGYDFDDPEIDEYGRFRMRAEGDGIEQAIEECANESSLGDPRGGESQSSSGEAGGA